MATEVPPPADDEFEQRLSWSPPVARRDPPDIPRPSRQGGPSAETDDPVGEDVSLRALVHDLRAELSATRSEMLRLREEVAELASTIGELAVEAAEATPVATQPPGGPPAGPDGQRFRIQFRSRSSS